MSDKGKQDFNGQIDGVGYKASMDNPKKPPLTQIPPTFLTDVAAVLGYGAQRYSPGNWMRGMSQTEVISAVQRHIQAWLGGQECDEESGLPHLSHAACGLAFMSWFRNGPRADEYAKFDDRLFKPHTGDNT